VLIFQPLKALMQEQVERAGGIGLRAALVNSDQDPEEQLTWRPSRPTLGLTWLASVRPSPL
jgi:superfamily II DNA helicase RecQ